MTEKLQTASPLYLAIKSGNHNLITSMLEWVKVTPKLINYQDNFDGMTAIMLLLSKRGTHLLGSHHNHENFAINLVEAGADVINLKAKSFYTEDYGSKNRDYNVLNLAIANNKADFFSFLVKNKKITKKHVEAAFRLNAFEYALSMKCSDKILNALKDLGIKPLDIKKTWMEIKTMSQLDFLKLQGVPEFNKKEVYDIFIKIALERKNLPERLQIVKELLAIFKVSLDKEVLKSVKSCSKEVIFKLIGNTDHKTFKLFFSFFGKPFGIKSENNDNLLLASLKVGEVNLAKYFLPHCGMQEFNNSEQTAILALLGLNFHDKRQRTLSNYIFNAIEGKVDFNKVDSKGCNLLHDTHNKELLYNNHHHLFYLPFKFKKELLKLVNVKDNEGLTPLMSVCLPQNTFYAREIIHECVHASQKIDYNLCDSTGIPLLAYMFLLFRFSGDNTHRYADAKKVVDEMFLVPEVKALVDNYTDSDVNKLLMQVMDLSMGRANSCSTFVMRNTEVFRRIELFLEYFPNFKINTDVVVDRLAVFMEDKIKNDNDVIDVPASMVFFLSNSRVGQRGKEVLIKLVCENSLNKQVAASFINTLLEEGKVMFPLDEEYLSVFREDLDLWSRIEKCTFNNKLAIKDTSIRLNKI